MNEYPVGLAPEREDIFVRNGDRIALPVVSLAFKKWDGTPVNYTFGRKPIVDYEGKPMFAELAIMQIAVKSGWSARWVKTFGSTGKLPLYFQNGWMLR